MYENTRAFGRERFVLCFDHKEKIVDVFFNFAKRCVNTLQRFDVLMRSKKKHKYGRSL